MSIGRPLAAIALALVSWLAVAVVGFLLAAAFVSGAAGGARLVFPVATVVAAVAAAMVTVLVLQGVEAHRRPGRGVMLGLALIWPVVFGVGGIIDGRVAGEPEGFPPVVGVLGVGLAAAAAHMMIDRVSPKA